MHLIFILVLWSSLVLAQSRTLVFEFDPVEGATTYDFEFRVQGTSEVVRKLSQKNAEVEITLPLNKYEYRQRTADRRKVSGSWSNWEKFDVSAPEIKITSPKVDDVIDSNEAKSKKVEIAWSGGEAVDEFNVKIIDQFTKVEVERFTTKNRQTAVELPVAAAYEVTVSAKLPDSVPAELGATAVAQFSILAKELADPEIIPVLNIYSQKITWKNVEYAQTYDVTIQLFSKENKKWQTVYSKKNHPTSEIDFDPTWSGGKYRIKVLANGNLRKRSPASVQKFQLASVRTPAAEYNSLLAKTIDRVDGYFTQISWLVTQMNLNSYQHETATASAARPLGGTLRAGLGYFRTGKPWGVIGFVNTSRMILNGVNRDFTGFEINSMYRHKFESRDELRLSLGLSQKQIPVIVNESVNAAFKIHNSNVTGPRLGAEYWYAVTPRWGIQANYNLNLYNLIGNSSAPNGKKMEVPNSFQAGLLASYQFSDRISVLLGLTHQEENYQYSALTEGTMQPVQAGAINAGFLKANYIGLMVEIGL